MGEALISKSPWNDRQTVFQGECSSAQSIISGIQGLVDSADAWASDHAGRRTALLNLAQIITQRREPLVGLLIREAGKVREDAEAEADNLVKKIAITLEQGLARTPVLGPDGTGAEPERVWRPRGLAAVLGPFNFPLHLLHGLVVPALAVGCTVVAKPSERCPALGEFYSAMLKDSALHSVCLVVQGGVNQVHTIFGHPALTTVAAVGSYATGQALAQALAHRPEVVLALEMGGVNHALVLDDAELGPCAKDLADGAWRMAGQRCTATRVVHVPRRHLDTLLALLVRARERWVPDGTPAGRAGPLISPSACQGYLQAYATLPSGLELAVGEATMPIAHSCCVDPLLLVTRTTQPRSNSLYRDEHFYPALIVDPYSDEDECLQRMRENPSRLAAAVFTTSRRRFLHCAQRLPYGQVNHNRPTAGARSDQPFGGCGRSGNGRPAALAACAIFADETVIWPST